MTVELEIEAKSERPAAARSNVIMLNSKVSDTIIWPVAGGKGGTGKSTLTANMASVWRFWATR
jgi:Mrp family chromosome partitioning ATPase